MKLSAAREAYYDASSTASAVTRQFSLAGIAFIWLLSGGLSTGIRLTERLLLAALMLVTSLSFDLFQYVSKMLTWGIWARRKEKGIIKNKTQSTDGIMATELGSAPAWFNWPPLFFLVVKISAAICAYVILGLELQHRIHVQ